MTKLSDDPAVLPEPKFENISLKKIVNDPNQPRSFFDEQALEELTQSVQEKGVLQPILVRQSGESYMIVCGERRYKAALSVNALFEQRDTIPAIIRDISDDEALELQIIENLQRKDVHPMEEAVAFMSLIDHGKDIKEIAARVGKSEFYARQRVKLCALNKDWQSAFFANRLSVSEALKVAVFDEKIQNELFEENGRMQKIELSSWDLRNYQGKLKEACFNLSDETLDKKVGACTNCKFNSATAQLFQESALDPQCTNVTCFKNKSDLHFNREIELAKEDPEVIFISDEYGVIASEKNVSKLTKAGYQVLGRHFYSLMRKPELISFEEWKDDNSDDYEPEEWKQQYKRQEVDSYNRDLADYEKKLSSGKFKKAFMVTGEDRGKYIFITLDKNKSSSTTSAKVMEGKQSSGNVTAQDIDEEIKRIQDKELRSKEIDQNKIWGELRVQFNPHANAGILKDEFTQVEREAIARALYNKLDYKGQGDFTKLFKIDRRKEDYSGVDEIQLRQMIRFYMLDILPPAELNYGFSNNADVLACMKIAGAYFPSVLSDIMEKQNEITAKRTEKINKRIAELKAQKKELVAKPTKTKSSTKKIIS